MKVQWEYLLGPTCIYVGGLIGGQINGKDSTKGLINAVLKGRWSLIGGTTIHGMRC